MIAKKSLAGRTGDIQDNKEPAGIVIDNYVDIEGDAGTGILTDSTLTEKIMSVAKTNNRVYKPKIYKEVISNLIYSKR